MDTGQTYKMSGRSWRPSEYPPLPHPHNQHQDYPYPEDHYNSPRHLQPGSLSGRDSVLRPPPPHYFTSSAQLDPGPTTPLRTAVFGRPLSSSPAPGPAASSVRQDGALPPKLYECPGVIACFQVRGKRYSAPFLPLPHYPDISATAGVRPDPAGADRSW